MSSTEIVRPPVKEDTDRELQGLYQALLDSGLRFYQTVEESGLYSKKAGMRELGERGIQSNIFGGMWSFAVSSLREYPFGREERPFYLKRLLWGFRMKEGPREGLLRRRGTKELDKSSFRVNLSGFPAVLDRIEFETQPDSWRLKSCRSLEVEEPFGTVEGEKLDVVEEEMSLYGGKTKESISLTISRRISVSRLSLELSTDYRKEDRDEKQGVLVLNYFDRKFEITRASRQQLLTFESGEIEAAEKKLLDTFPDQVMIVDLMREKFGVIISDSDQTIEDLRGELATVASSSPAVS